ncbi:pyridoxal phosphate-dependent aminotransferase [Psychrobacter sp. FDAARGOS_221]|uniref:pyridoxal phosphate-dependent aminotransferase n=1 Tax=Psychrobacter sp. FDAARGOS_221 TaxID=1975705 RepID=UPI000BB557C1|nr:histidinol-phosphate transaminase [Psychrobacter sp. FDAARGOS_221]PNK60058.1 histidinol-phosphate aminotransferase family protein [Psychrobacter sp. FDAARGOS_221]
MIKKAPLAAINHKGIALPSDVLRLNFNENALGMPPSAKQAIADHINLAFRYPDEYRRKLISKLATRHNVTESQISMGNGSSENIRSVVQMLNTKALSQGLKFQVIIPTPTFHFAELYASLLNIPVVRVPLISDDFAIDLETMQCIADKFDGISLFYLVNPNNPTSTIIKSKKLQKCIKDAPDNHYFLLDEAYGDYVRDPGFTSGIDLIKQQLSDNIIVTRTFSKLYAMAGLRVGYAISNALTVKSLESFMSLDNTNLAGALAASAALDDTEFRDYALQSNNEARLIVENALDELGLRYLDSQACFVLHEITTEVPLYQSRMAEHNILVGREFLPIRGYNRVSLGTPEQMQKFVTTLKLFRDKNWL